MIAFSFGHVSLAFDKVDEKPPEGNVVAVDGREFIVKVGPIKKWSVRDSDQNLAESKQ